LLLGGFVLPNPFDRLIASEMPTQTAGKVAEHVVNHAPEEAVEPIVPSGDNTKPASENWPNLGDPITVGPLPSGPAYELAKVVDRHIDDALIKAGVARSPVATDAEYLRRAYLDLTGKIPTHTQALEFLNDSDPKKRSKLIDELLDSSAFGKHFAHIWAEMLIKRDADTNRGLDAEPFIDWFAKQLNDSRGWEAIVTDLITADGKVSNNPATFFTIANQDNNQASPAKLVGATSNLFMGVQLQCAECHVHPVVDDWKQQDFWGMAAFFGHVQLERDGQKPPRSPVSEVKEVARQAQSKGKLAQKQGVKAIPPGDVISIPDPTDAKKTTGTAKARYFEANENANLGSQTPFRPKLAAWLTSPDNKYFAKAAVNRFWAHVFARGIINPVEDMGPQAVASHPELLDELARAFVANKFDVKFILRAYCNSQAYNRTSKPTVSNASDEALLSHMPIKVIGARELLDSLAIATGSTPGRTPNRQPREKGAAKGVQAPATGVRFFDKREYEDVATEFSYGIPQLLKQMNTNLTNNLNVVNRFAKSGRDREEIIIDLFLAILSRRPRPTEMERLEKYAESKKDTALDDIAWALLNSAEFVSNH